MKKTKVIWICNFANEEIKNILRSEKDFFAAPWISELIELFRNKEDIDLTIISPNYFNNEYKYFCLDNIKVYLYKYRRSFLPHVAYNLSFNYNTATNSVLKILCDLNPDIIHLHGSENPFYAASVFNLLDKYPTLVTIQGFVSLSQKPKNVISRYIRWNRVRFERKINSKSSYFTLVPNRSLEDLKMLNKSAKIYNNYYPTTKPNIVADNFPDKIYDIVYYARITKSKGVEDLIEAIKVLKIKRPHISAIIIGGGSKRYTDYIKTLIHTLNLNDNITFAGFQSTQQDVFKLAAQAKLYVLPTHFDGIPGSLREAMFMRLPVIANAVGGIPAFNNDKECITLVEKHNINDLVQKIELVLDDDVRTKKLVENAYEIICDKYDNGKIYQNLITIYKDILKIEKVIDVE